MVEGGQRAGGRAILLPLLLLLTALDIVLLGVAADAFNKFINKTLTGFNGMTSTTVLFALIEGVFLGAAIIIGYSHLIHYVSGSVGIAVATGLVAWGVDLLALGFAAKEISIGGIGPQEKAIDSLIIVIAFFETLYFLTLFGGLHTSSLGVAYDNPV